LAWNVGVACFKKAEVFIRWEEVGKDFEEDFFSELGEFVLFRVFLGRQNLAS
jgi:hypothetical protein